jgi:hypothetical protein
LGLCAVRRLQEDRRDGCEENGDETKSKINAIKKERKKTSEQASKHHHSSSSSHGFYFLLFFYYNIFFFFFFFFSYTIVAPLAGNI